MTLSFVVHGLPSVSPHHASSHQGVVNSKLMKKSI